jgi:uncharacterized protein YjbI with pentapeptide repeats
MEEMRQVRQILQQGRRRQLGALLLIAALLGLAVASVAVFPQPLVEQDLGPGVEQLAPAERARAHNEIRIILLLAVAGVAVLAGAAVCVMAGYRHRRDSRQGQLTEWFRQTVRQLDSDQLDVHLGAVYALAGRMKGGSASDAGTITELLSAYVRAHARAPAGPSGPEAAGRAAGAEADGRDGGVIGDLAPLQVRAPGVQAVMNVLARMPTPERSAPPLQLNGVDLRRASLAGARLRQALLSEAHLEGAVLTHAHLQDACINRASLDGAVLGGAHLERAVLLGSSLKGAVLVGAYLDNTILDFAHLEGAHLLGARLRGAKANRVHLNGAVLLGGHLERATIVGSCLAGAMLTGVHLQEADLSDSDLRRADLRRADLRRVELHGTDLREADLRGANLAQASLIEADLRGARSNAATRWPINFDPTAAGVLHDAGRPGSTADGRPPLPEPRGTPSSRPLVP